MLKTYVVVYQSFGEDIFLYKVRATDDLMAYTRGYIAVMGITFEDSIDEHDRKMLNSGSVEEFLDNLEDGVIMGIIEV